MKENKTSKNETTDSDSKSEVKKPANTEEKLLGPSGKKSIAPLEKLLKQGNYTAARDAIATPRLGPLEKNHKENDKGFLSKAGDFLRFLDSTVEGKSSYTQADGYHLYGESGGGFNNAKTKNKEVQMVNVDLLLLAMSNAGAGPMEFGRTLNEKWEGLLPEGVNLGSELTKESLEMYEKHEKNKKIKETQEAAKKQTPEPPIKKEPTDNHTKSETKKHAANHSTYLSVSIDYKDSPDSNMTYFVNAPNTAYNKALEEKDAKDVRFEDIDFTGTKKPTKNKSIN